MEKAYAIWRAFQDRLVAPLAIVHGREVLEAIDAERWRAVASVLAVKK